MVGARTSPLLLSALALSSLLACADQPSSFDRPPEVTSGAYSAFLQRGYSLPSGSSEWRAIGFDLDGDRDADNMVGTLLGTLANIGLEIGLANDAALTTGALQLTHVVRADSPIDDPTVSVTSWTGAGTAPRFDGTDRPSLDAMTGELIGETIGGRTSARWGTATVNLPLFPSQPPVLLPIDDARLELTVSAGTCRGRVGGAMSGASLDFAFEQVAAQTLAHMAAHPDHSFTRTATDFFDRNDDGAVTTAEIVEVGHWLIVNDLDSDGDRSNDSVSFAIGFDCVPAQLADDYGW